MRDQILNEIKRVASATGAVPGKRVFERSTGIKEHIWLGVYWTKWSDALKDAGFGGNEMQAPYASESVLGSIAEACRHYGRFPTRAELTMYGRGKVSFPSEKTIRNRFQKRNDLVRALVAFAQSNSSFEDILGLLPQVVDVSVPSGNGRVEGAVYLLKSGTHFKIGRSDQIERRVKEIRVSLPEAVALVHSIRTDDPAGIEAYWHRRFADYRANGEWFKLGPQEIAAFRKRKYQ